MENGNLLEYVHWFSTGFFLACAAASYLVQVIPPPTEISWRPYVIVFNTIQRLSMAGRTKWQNGNGQSKAAGA